MLKKCYLLPGAEFYVAVDNAGLWPNLTLLPAGEIAAAAYDYPGHAIGNGNINLWVSDDGGRLWRLRSTVSEHSNDNDFVRNNLAAGLNAQGELVVLVGGWSKGVAVPEPIQVCISKDKGHTWSRHEINNKGHPFGDIVLNPDGRLACAIHDDSERKSYIYWSKDKGISWEDRQLLASNGTETALLCCKNGKWLAAMRRCTGNNVELRYHNNELQLFTLTDGGDKWGDENTVSLPNQSPAHLLELSNGNILLTYGSRIEALFGVIAKISKDNGKSWSKDHVLISIPGPADCGYPSNVQLEDGTIVTAYYFGPKHHGHKIAPGGLPWHSRYHMGVARWQLEAILNSE